MTAQTTNLTGNSVLDALPADTRDGIVMSGRSIPLERGAVLYDIDEIVNRVWFPYRGVVSWITAAPDSEEVETAIVGSEGFVGVQVLLQGGSVSGRSYVSLPGEALELDARVFTTLTAQFPDFSTCLSRFVLALITQVTQLSLCNRLHPMEQRCARWLLMCLDRVDGDEFNLTHEALAQMLGVRRASVTVALGALARVGILDSRQGQIRVLNRDRHREWSCPCYHVLRQEYSRLT